MTKDEMLHAGSAHEVLKNFPAPDDFVNWIKPMSEKLQFTELCYFWLARYTLKGSSDYKIISDRIYRVVRIEKPSDEGHHARRQREKIPSLL